MHILIALVTGIVVALMSSVPVGPINFAIMQTVMTRGKRIAMMIGMMVNEPASDERSM